MNTSELVHLKDFLSEESAHLQTMIYILELLIHGYSWELLFEQDKTDLLDFAHTYDCNLGVK